MNIKNTPKFNYLGFGFLVLKDKKMNIYNLYEIGGKGMNNVEDKKSIQGNIIQNIFLENREKLNISGVIDVLSFDDQIVIVETELGLLTVKGEDLRINKLSIDTSEVIVEGEIYNLGYSEKEYSKKETSFIGKLFK